MGFFSKEKNKIVGQVVLIPAERLIPNPSQPRRRFDQAELENLSESIKRNGILQPISVRKVATGDCYEIIAGERRYRAAKMAGMEELPCIVMETTAGQSAVLALLENLQRQDLSVFEEARAIGQLIEVLGLTQEEAAAKLGKAQSTIANKLRLLRLTGEEIEIIEKNHLTERHARALLSITDPIRRREVLDEVVKGKHNVMQTEKLVEEVLQGRQRQPHKKKGLCVVKDVRLFFNTVNRAIQTMQKAGINAVTVVDDKEEFIEYRVRIPKASAKPA